MKFLDVSMNICEEMPVYPGDPSFELKWFYTIENAPYSLSGISMSSHCGTHVDAPKHFVKDGKSIDEMDIEKFCGKAKLISVAGKNIIRPEDLYSFDITRDQILILKTDNTDYFHSSIITDNFAFLSEDAAVYLAEKRIKAFGFDYITVDRNEDYPVHKTFLSADIPIIEGLNLCDAEPGDYLFVGLPLRIRSAEASPIRAILIKE